MPSLARFGRAGLCMVADAGELIGWQIGVWGVVLLMGIMSFLLSALFQGQARFAGEVAELLREKEEKEAGPAPDAVKVAAPPASDPVR